MKKIQLVFTLLIIIILSSLRNIPLIQKVNKLYEDTFITNLNNLSAIDTNIVYVLITQNSLNRGENFHNIKWPWQREIYTYVMQYLINSNAKFILLDFFFSEASIYGPEDDSIFFSFLQNNSDKIGTGIIFTKAKNKNSINKIKYNAIKYKGNITNIKKFDSYIDLPYNYKIKLGAVNLIQDIDGNSREMIPIFNCKKLLFPNLAILPFLKKEIIVQQNKIQLGTRIIPLTNRGTVKLKYYSSSEKYKKYDIMDILETAATGENDSIVNPMAFKNKIIIIGSDAPGLKDLRKNPFSLTDPGVHIYGTFINNLINNDFLKEQNNIIILIIIFIFLIFLAYILMRIKNLTLSIISSIIFFIILQTIFYLILKYQNLILPYTQITLSFVIGYSSFVLYNFYQQNKQKKIIQSAFSQLISPVILKKLLNKPQLLKPGGETKKVTIFFSDIASFTSLSEKITAQELVEILNIYLSKMTEIIVQKNNGFIDKFIGDAIMAFWGTPIKDENHAINAANSAIECQKAMSYINNLLKEKGLDIDLSIRIGINTGNVVAGMIGSQKKLNYTIMGDAVNLASRLEGINKHYNTKIILSNSSVKELSSNFITRKLDIIKVKGKTQPTTIYELVGKKNQINDNQLLMIKEFETGLNLYLNKQFQEALNIFKKNINLDPVASIFADRCKYYLQNPPPKNWDGIFIFTSK